ncbi:MAG: hypothetical protein J2P27_19620 [Actinobacteria bacterium]|nr:hypothetical protein [Actinomycetota bacterium]
MGDNGLRRYSVGMLDSSEQIKKLAADLNRLVEDFRSANKRAVAELEGQYITQYNLGLQHLQDTMNEMSNILHGGGLHVADAHSGMVQTDGQIANSMPNYG